MTEDEWHELRVRVEAWEAWRQAKADEEARKNCKHPRKVGSGSVSSDGSGSLSWSCPDCGANENSTWPPRDKIEIARAS